MERKISLYILIPEHNKRINYLVPQSMLLRTMVKLVCKTLKKTGVPIKHDAAYGLISIENGMFMSLDKSIYDSGITDGCELLLIGGSNG